jgi:hypothetical protein
MDREEIAKHILKLLDCSTENLVDEIYRLSNAIKCDVDPNLFTGYFDDGECPICVGDYVRISSTYEVSVVEQGDDGEFVVDVGDNSWEYLKDVKCCVINEEVDEYNHMIKGLQEAYNE